MYLSWTRSMTRSVQETKSGELRQRRQQQPKHNSASTLENDDKKKKQARHLPVDNTRSRSFNWSVFIVSFMVRLPFAGWLNQVWDCDETYNYWEAMHAVAYSSGLQTWEYSPVYALRSYLYLLVHMAPAHSFAHLYQHMLQLDPTLLLTRWYPSTKLFVFFGTRVVFGALAPAWLDSNMYVSLRQTSNKNNRTSVHTFYLLLSLGSVGLWTSVSSLLPSASCLLCVMYAYGQWFTRRLDSAVVAMGVAGLVCWPFALLLGAPILLDYALFANTGGLARLVKCLLVYGGLLLGTLVGVDSYFYGRVVLAPLNIVLYNVLNSGAGPELYGVEPFSFYVKNMLLNLNVCLPLAILVLPLTWLLCIRPRNVAKSMSDFDRQVALTYLLGVMAWLGVLGTRPHKEERFMYPIYPLVIVLAAVALDHLRSLVMSSKKSGSLALLANTLIYAVILAHLVLSASRFAALHVNYSGQASIFAQLNEPSVKQGSLASHLWHSDTLRNEDDLGTINVCMGKEWYRFPSSYWLPGMPLARHACHLTY